ncbi:MAG: tyrosine--tRNA ligase [Actinomycetota bacterium]|nr:tyrosine--tRNA ligase [Actinomycetota bacterium]
MGELALGPAEQAAWLARNAVDCLPRGELERKLAQGRPLRVKLGIDPTAPDIHLGHTIVLRKLREFQDLGHLIVLIIGDYTARVGDPSGRSELRPMLDGAEIEANALTFQEQAFAVLDRHRVEVRHNSEWLEMPMQALFALARTATVAQILEREDFAKRLAAATPVSVLELLYPLLQGYDSVAVNADVELGGTDQKFNLLLARDVQRAYGIAEQVVLTMPILPGTDGVRRMGKSLGNYIAVRDSAADIYGKTLSIPDQALDSWYALLMDDGAERPSDPLTAKRQLASVLAARFHGSEQSAAAEAEFDKVHRRHEAPSELPELELTDQDGQGRIHLPLVLSHAFGISTSEARRALVQGGVRLDGAVVAADPLDLPSAELDGRVLQLGRRRFARLWVR